MRAGNLFDTLRTRFNIKSDSAFARELDVDPSAICRARKNGHVSDSLVVRISRYLGPHPTEILELAGQDLPSTVTTITRRQSQ